jgi:2-(1,2-epoxy-1,2-dihydrophenyl)acetyl-CoA isomerase
MSEPVLVERDKGIAKVFLNRPEAYNAFEQEFLEALAEHMVALAVDDGVKGIVITGKGKAFCAGGDLKYVHSYPDGPSTAFHLLSDRFHSAVTEIRRMGKPVIAAINGAAAGGGFSLALACDFRVMEKSARMRQAYTSNGLCIDGGGTFMLARLAGLARAMEIVGFDEPISAEQALEWGLVTRVVDDGKSLEAAVEMAGELARGSLNSFAWAKRLLTDSFDTPFETHIEREREGICTCSAHPDGLEAIAAFVEKRKPVFGKE